MLYKSNGVRKMNRKLFGIYIRIFLFVLCLALVVYFVEDTSRQDNYCQYRYGLDYHYIKEPSDIEFCVTAYKGHWMSYAFDRDEYELFKKGRLDMNDLPDYRDNVSKIPT